MTLIIIVFEFCFTDSGSHYVKIVDWFFCFDSRAGTIAGSLIFAIDVIFAEVSVFGVDQLGTVDVQFGYILAEG